ncbi:NADPH-dependent FMN reductase [Microvirga thermotolerans]|uniref:FMN reductase n=1 Tax=Microvirga thermotolerans TaxID=2651334 RepID=A0A5P9JTY9_9HYPH|nr:NAD(P)H-dependent oxidoreductase [Microvirga thermotolerans]QFU15893.1 FMN reductase [Microvirga thermotolerans]
MNDPLNVALIYGSTREGRLCEAVADWVAGAVREHGDFTLEPVDPAMLDPRPGAKDDPALETLRGRLDRADAFIVVTPEYNHSFPAPLKFLIDSAYREWHAKPVAFVSYGGISGGLRAVEQLRLVFAELHAVGIRDCVSLAYVWNLIGPDGRLDPPAETRQAMPVMLSRLSWWATMLRGARQAAPYSEAAA